jgi:hypothetical protein
MRISLVQHSDVDGFNTPPAYGFSLYFQQTVNQPTNEMITVLAKDLMIYLSGLFI